MTAKSHKSQVTSHKSRKAPVSVVSRRESSAATCDCGSFGSPITCKRIGILGGTFDPPHRGHLAIARAARHSLKLDRVVLVPTKHNPLKEKPAAPAGDRLQMTRLLAGEAGFDILDLELKRRGPSYTVDTLLAVRRMWGDGVEIYLIAGSDTLKDFDRWKDPGRVLSLCRIATTCRPAPDGRLRHRAELPARRRAQDAFGECWVSFKMEPAPFSSSAVREAIASGGKWKQALTPGVGRYIESHGLYAPAAKTREAGPAKARPGA